MNADHSTLAHSIDRRRSPQRTCADAGERAGERPSRPESCLRIHIDAAPAAPAAVVRTELPRYSKMAMTIKEMRAGDSGRVLGFEEGGRAYRRKLLSMGLTPGVEFQVVRVAPLGDPVEVKVRGSNLSLRRDEAAALQVERVN
jgi:ferrous iron transport protein A